MTLPTSSIVITAGSGTNLAAQTVSSKLYQVMMLAGPQGHIRGTRDSYIAVAFANSAVGVSKVHYDLWNGSSNTIEVHGIWINNDFAVGIAGTVALRIDAFRTTAVGTGGTAFTFENTSATESITRIDPNGATLPAGISMRKAPTGGATSGAFIGQAYFQQEEGVTSIGYLTQWQNMVRYAGMDDVKELVIPPSSGLKLVQGPVAAVGQVGMRMVFTVY